MQMQLALGCDVTTKRRKTWGDLIESHKKWTKNSLSGVVGNRFVQTTKRRGADDRRKSERIARARGCDFHGWS